MANEDKKILEELARAEQEAKSFNMQLARVDDKTPSPEALRLIDKKLALEYRLVPLFLKDKKLSIGFADVSLFKNPMPEFLVSLRDQYELEKYVIISSDFEEAVKAYGEIKMPDTDLAPQETGSATKPTNQAQEGETENLADSDRAKKSPDLDTQKVSSATPIKNWPTVDLLSLEIPKETLERFPEEVAKKYSMVVFEVGQGGKFVKVASINPNDPRVQGIVSFVEKRNKIKVELYQADQSQIAKVLTGYEAEGYKPNDNKEDKGITKQTPIENTPTDFSANLTANDQAIPEPVEESKLSPEGGDLSSSGISIQRSGVDRLKQIADENTRVNSDFSNQQPAQNSSEATQKIDPVNNSAPNQVIAPSAPIDISSSSQASAPAKNIAIPNPSSTPVGQFADLDLDSQLNGAITNESQLEDVLKTAMAPKIVAGIVSYAVSREVSDIHIEPLEDSLMLRYRIDGVLQEIAKMPKNLLAPIISRIKILSNLKIDEIRLPQDGRFSAKASDQEIDLRVSTLPAVFGEKAVLRILNKTTGVKEIEDLDFFDTNLDRVKKPLEEPYGIILITGPTGSGKSTTLYAMLKRLNTSEVNIVTLEDPVEYQMEGINQTQVKDKIGYSFADGLRSIVRQDPDIIMVGEIRDKETATLSTQAALTGHLVLSTLHTNNAAGAIPRLIDMEVEPFLLSSSVNSIIAQRLVRKLCENCKQPADVPTETLEKVKQILAGSKAPEASKALSEELKFHKAVGCDVCKSGFKGRIGIFEVLTMSENLASLTVKKAITSQLDEAARAEGMVSMRVDGVLKALRGFTTLDEILQVTAD